MANTKLPARLLDTSAVPALNVTGDLTVDTTTLKVDSSNNRVKMGDTAVAVNPSDPRYKDLVGKLIKLPMVNRSIPIIADDYVDPEFVTGCVKITPAHDFNDY